MLSLTNDFVLKVNTKVVFTWGSREIRSLTGNVCLWGKLRAHNLKRPLLLYRCIILKTSRGYLVIEMNVIICATVFGIQLSFKIKCFEIFFNYAVLSYVRINI